MSKETDYGNANSGSPEESLKRVRDTLHSESARIQIQGRALSEDELRRVDVLNRAIESIDQAISALEGDGSGGENQ